VAYSWYLCGIWMEWMRKIPKIIILVMLWADFEPVGSCLESRNDSSYTITSTAEYAIHYVVPALSHSVLTWRVRGLGYVQIRGSSDFTSEDVGTRFLQNLDTYLQDYNTAPYLRKNTSIYYSRIRKWILSILLSVCLSIYLYVCMSVTLCTCLDRCTEHFS
jgi:hypothetical protein